MEIKVDNEAVEQLVQKHIRLAVAEALRGKTDYLVGRLVDEALRKPHKDSYSSSKQTIIEKATDDMICAAASEAANEWLAEQKPKIKALVAQKLGSATKGLVASVAEQLTMKLATGFEVNVWFKDRS